MKGDIYEGLLAKSAEESPKGAGQYFTPRELIKGIVDCVQPGPGDTICDPAVGTGGFLLAAYNYVVEHFGKELDKDQKKHLRTKFVQGADIVRHGPAVHHELAPARHRRRSLPDQYGQSGDDT